VHLEEDELENGERYAIVGMYIHLSRYYHLL
jgi:hypothetical protein